MRIETHPVSDWQANCHLVAAGSGQPGSQCIVVDAGPGAEAVVDEVCRSLDWHPVAVLATHGHLDHVADAARIANRRGIPLHSPAPDREMLSTPSAGLGAAFRPLVEMLLGSDSLPTAATLLAYTGELELAGLAVRPIHAPGHTPGSTLLHIRDGDDQVVLTGDVLFAGSIGRTDLPGGSMQQMRESLRALVAWAPPHVPLLPGHGPGTTLARELAGNPYLQPDFLEVER